ncbi:hypothetical protein GPECTOR_52g64 [Gonium pectorale]|uniref:PAS domain-containing protein n=1 Tax=Gonium pectorale TaxID=33097 RepID=A0A150G722_GONPE|nr:hypothetical protein GPECTOR_52g64 [Gonium pectorale]|eukprot:KXZ45666.1 hypothetical protein GPECTOR_52g64 [Gonium pectorale]
MAEALLTLVDVFIGYRTVAACIYLVLALALAYQYVRWNPHMVAWMNMLKSGVSAAIVWCAATLVLLVFHPVGNDPREVENWSSVMTIVMLAGLGPAFGVGVYASWAMTRFMTKSTLRSLANMQPNEALEDVCTNVDDPRDVELVARCARVWREGKTLDPDAVAKAHTVIKAGLAMFPQSAYMVLLHANYMIDVLGVSQSGNSRIEDARKLNPGLMCRFIMFVRQQQASTEYFAEAERLEELKNADSNGPVLPDGTPLGRMDEMTMGVVVLALSGEIQVANRQTHTVFGIKRGNLEGKSFSALVAPHCGRWIVGQLREMVNEGEIITAAPQNSVAIYREGVLVGMHTDRIAFPLKVSLSRVSGVGEDSTFVALLEPLQPEKDVATLWLSQNGTIAACDVHFASFFGWRAYEVNGAGLTAFASITQTAVSDATGAADVETGAVRKRRPGEASSDAIARLLARARANTDASAAAEQQSQPQGLPCVVVHKYDSNPVACMLTIKQADATEMPVYEARIRLATPTPPQLLVANRKGVLIHVSADIVACLKDSSAGHRGRHSITNNQGSGRPVAEGGNGNEDVGGEGSPHMAGADELAAYTLSDFLPSPWKDMHVKLLKDTTAMTAPSRSQHSCRKGGPLASASTLEMRTTAGKPLYMRVAVTTSDMSGELTHVVHVARSSLETALEERRLRLSVSEEGLIQSVQSGSPSQLFGMEANKIVGRGLWELIEGLGAIGQDGGSTTPGPQAFKALANRSLIYPGSSWRVRITPPQRAKPGPMSDLNIATRLSAARLAVLQLHLETIGGRDDDAEEEVANVVVDLWPTTSVSGVLELDAGGCITSVLEEDIRPAGLLFGLPSHALVGTPLTDFVTLPSGRSSPGDLLSLHGAKKSSLKVKKQEVHVKVGPVHVLQGLHSDGQPVMLDVQVVGKPGPNQPVTAIIRLHKAPLMPTGASGGAAAGGAAANAVAATVAAPVRSSKASWMQNVDGMASGLGSDADSDNGPLVRRELSKVSEATERVAAWVTSKGNFYQNTVRPGASKESRALRTSPSGLRAASEAAPYPDDDAASVAASEGGQSAMSAQSGAGGGAEYRRGKRFRKLAKMMDSSQAQQVSQRFRRHSMGVLAVLALVHVVFFTLVMNAVQMQKRSMMNLGRSDESQRFMHRIMTDVRSLDVISRNRTVPNLYRPEDATFFLKRVAADAEEVKVRLNEMLQAHHTKDSKVVQIFYHTPVPDFGTEFYNSAKEVVQSFTDMVAEGIPISATPEGQFIIKSGPDLWKASRKALDAMLFAAVDDTDWVDTLQLVFLAIEGAFLSSLAALYIAYLLRAVAAQRYKLYSTFLVIPVGLTRALASQNTALLVDEDDDDDDIENEETERAAITEQEEPEDEDKAVKAKRRATLNVAGSDGMPSNMGIPIEGAPRSKRSGGLFASPLNGKGSASMRLATEGKEEKRRRPAQWVWNLLTCGFLPRHLQLALGWRGKGVSPLPTALAAGNASTNVSRRVIRYDSHETALMITPFVIWSMVVISLYAAAVIILKVFFTQELGNIDDPVKLPAGRAALVACQKVMKDAYYTLELGADAYMVTGPNTEQFPMVKTGLAFASEELADVLYKTGKCHRTKEHAPCPGPEYRFYQLIYNGVDSIMQHFLRRLATLAESHSTTPPGLDDGILLLHIVLFLLMWLVIAGFLFVLLNPVLKRVSRERRHIAELMSQLPLELDVEKLVARALGTLSNTKGSDAVGAGLQERTMSGGTDGHESDNGNDATNKWKAIIRR